MKVRIELSTLVDKFLAKHNKPNLFVDKKNHMIIDLKGKVNDIIQRNIAEIAAYKGQTEAVLKKLMSYGGYDHKIIRIGPHDTKAYVLRGYEPGEEQL